METARIIGIGIIGTILCVMLKDYRPELSVCVAILTGIAVIWQTVPTAYTVINEIYELFDDSKINASYFKMITKIIGIAYITQFSSEIAKDAGFGAIAKKLEFAGKISVIFIMLPAVRELIDIIINTLSGF